MRQTSVSAYRKIRDEGLLSKRRWEVYNVLFHHGPLTATGIASKIPNFKSPSVGFNVHARLCELRARLVVEELGQIVCPYTKMMVINWDVTADLPIDVKRIAKKKKCGHCSGTGYESEDIDLL